MRQLFILIISLSLLSSCKVFKSNLMLKTPDNFVYDKLSDSVSNSDYRVSPNDLIQFKILSNNGFKMIDLTTNISVNNIIGSIDLTVESNGEIKMPSIGRVNVSGLTIRELESFLEEKYSKLYQDPYVTAKVTNKRVIIFLGNGGQAKVNSLSNNNTSIMEAIATAGGILEDGKAYKIKLIRNNPDRNKKPFVYLMDLSTINGLTLANSKVQANDIIYVEPRFRLLNVINKEITPLVTLITTSLIFFQLFRK